MNFKFIFLLFLGWMMTGCGEVVLDNPTVSTERTYKEQRNDVNHTTQGHETTELALNGEDYLAIKGNFDSDNDVDFYQIQVDPQLFQDREDPYKVKFVAAVNGEALTPALNKSFPLTATSYKGEKAVAHEHQDVALLGGFEIDPGVSRVELTVKGVPKDGTASDKYITGNSYTVKLK